jgi:hypothetical protein
MCGIMSASIQPSLASVTKSSTSSSPWEASPASNALFDSVKSIDYRESAIRNAVKKWFGPLEMLDPKARADERARHESVLQTLLRLHRVSCNLVAEEQRIPVTERDIHAAIIILNRIAITVKGTTAAIINFCEARAVREKNPRANQLDPLQLRHLLSFHQDIPHEELNALDIQNLRAACEKSSTDEIQFWFETIARHTHALPKGTPQFLRQLVVDLWDAGHSEFLKPYAAELSVIDSAMFDSLGWENSRLFFAIFKRIHGSACRPVSIYLNDEDIDTAIEIYKQLGDSNQVVHFRAISTTFEPKELRRLERTILAASKESGSRIRKARPSPVALKKSVQLPLAPDIPRIFALKRPQTAS